MVIHNQKYDESIWWSVEIPTASSVLDRWLQSLIPLLIHLPFPFLHQVSLVIQLACQIQPGSSDPAWELRSSLVTQLACQIQPGSSDPAWVLRSSLGAPIQQSSVHSRLIYKGRSPYLKAARGCPRPPQAAWHSGLPGSAWDPAWNPWKSIKINANPNRWKSTKIQWT